MTPVYILIALAVINILIATGLTFYLVIHISKTNLVTKRQEEQIKLISPEPPSPNQATKAEEVEVPLDEQSPWQIPNDVKVEIEGGDTLSPLGYEVTNATS
jgi:hypothetical protein